MVGTIKVPIFISNKKVMSTLVIHPHDESTHFLKPIYENIPDKTVITGGLSKVELNELIDSHDRVMMMGHGSPWGLFSVGKFTDAAPYIIDNTTVYLLLQKQNSVFIWCNADQFVNRHQLKGLYSGMFISEVGEAMYCGLPNTPQSVVDESNDSFASMLGNVINKPIRDAYNEIKTKYSLLAESNAVALYNSNRLYLN